MEVAVLKLYMKDCEMFKEEIFEGWTVLNLSQSIKLYVLEKVTPSGHMLSVCWILNVVYSAYE